MVVLLVYRKYTGSGKGRTRRILKRQGAMNSKQSFNKKLTRLTILQAAKELFVEKRYRAISVDEIARCAGVTKRTVYGHFPSKLALFVHVFDDYLEQLHLQLTKLIKKDLPLDKLLRELTDALFTFTRQNEKFMRLFWTMGSEEFDGHIPDELIRRIKMWNRAMMDEVISVIKRPGNREMLGSFDPELLYHLMSAINKGIFLHTNKSDRFKIAAIDPDTLYRLMIDLIEKGLFGTMRDVTRTDGTDSEGISETAGTESAAGVIRRRNALL